MDNDFSHLNQKDDSLHCGHEFGLKVQLVQRE